MLQLTKYQSLLTISVFCSFFFFQVSFSQIYSLQNETSFLEVHGTSSLHDWHVDAQQQSGNLNLSTLNPLDIKELVFSVNAESLKSGKSSMDKNTYKALKTKSFKTIEFKMTAISASKKIADNLYNVSAKGDLTVSGVTKQILLDLKVKFLDNTILIDGEKSILMTNYGIKPPRALLGTIKTGDVINIIFKTVYKKTTTNNQ